MTSGRSLATTGSTSTAGRTAPGRRSSTCGSMANACASIVLDGVAPTDMRLPLFTARDAQRALDKALADCEAETACRRDIPRNGRPRSAT